MLVASAIRFVSIVVIVLRVFSSFLRAWLPTHAFGNRGSLSEWFNYKLALHTRYICIESEREHRAAHNSTRTKNLHLLQFFLIFFSRVGVSQRRNGKWEAMAYFRDSASCSWYAICMECILFFFLFFSRWSLVCSTQHYHSFELFARERVIASSAWKTINQIEDFGALKTVFSVYCGGHAC